jgi:hypothetical protein
MGKLKATRTRASLPECRKVLITSWMRPAELEPFTVTIGPTHVDPETIQMPRLAGRTDRRRAPRDPIRTVIGDVSVPTRRDTRDTWGPTTFVASPGTILERGPRRHRAVLILDRLCSSV